MERVHNTGVGLNLGTGAVSLLSSTPFVHAFTETPPLHPSEMDMEY